MNKKQNILFLLLISVWFIGSVGLAQIKSYNRAVELYQTKRFAEARLAIDSVVKHPETANDPAAWIQRGFIYYELYKANDRAKGQNTMIDYKLESDLRDSSIRSVFKGYTLNPDADLKTNGAKLITNYINSYYRMASLYLVDSVNASKSQAAFNKHIELWKQSDPDADVKARQIEYYKAVGSYFTEMVNRNNTDNASQELAKAALLKTLELDSENLSANINLGVLYCNQAIYLIQNSDVPDLKELDLVQENAVKLFKQALPFLQKAYAVAPKNKTVLSGLHQVHRGLYEFEKSEMYRKLLEETK